MVDGRWLEELVGVNGSVGPPKWSTRFGDGPCGSSIASVDITLEPRSDPRSLRLNRPVLIHDGGGLPRFGGTVSSVGSGLERTLEFAGWAKRAWDAILNPEPGARLWRDPWGHGHAPAPDASPRYVLDVSDVPIGVAEDRLYTQVVASYVFQLGTGGQDDIILQVVENDSRAQRDFDVLPYSLDLTPLGPISIEVAQGYARQQLAEFSIPEWTSPIVTNLERLKTLNGQPAHLAEVQAGHMVRMHGAPASFGGGRGLGSLNVVLGEVEYDRASPDEITLAPARVAVRSIADMARQAAEAAKAQEQAA